MRIFLVACLLATFATSAKAQMGGCKDFSQGVREEYAKEGMVFTVGRPAAMSWVLEMGDTDVKFRSRGMGMTGFRFKQGAPIAADAFAREVDGWDQAFEFDFGNSKVTVWASPQNQGARAEYKALLPHGGKHYLMYAMLESAAPDCPYAEALQETIRTLSPAD